MSYKWKLLRKIPGNHRWFLDENSGRVSCCDQSGARPHLTDDGTLWLNKELPIVISDYDGRICISAPVIKGRTDDKCHITCNLNEMTYLVREHDMRVEVHSPSGDSVKLLGEMKLVPA